MQFVVKKHLYDILWEEEIRKIKYMPFEAYKEKLQSDNAKAVEKAKQHKMPMYTMQGGKKTTDNKNTIAYLQDIITFGEAAKKENAFNPEYKEYRKFLGKGNQRIFVDATTFLMLEEGQNSGDQDSFSWMLNNCILMDVGNCVETIAQKAFEKFLSSVS